MSKKVTRDWKDWIELNIERGCDKDGMVRILLDEGFDLETIAEAMDYQPDVNMAQVENPLKAEASPVAQQAGQPSETSPAAAGGLAIANAQKLNSDQAEFYLLPEFLNEEECERLILLIKSRLRPSTVANPEQAESDYRTSSTCDLGIFEDSFMREIDDRICRTLGIDASYSEVIQGQYYEIGQEFKAHTDYFEEDEIEEYGGERGQRTYTFFIYLNSVEGGGETEFNQLGLKVSPQQGTAVIWNSLLPDGKPNPLTLHQAHPVSAGYKAVITKWFRRNGNGPMYTKEPNEHIPNFTQVGFEKSRLEANLFEDIRAYYLKEREHAADELVEGGFVYSQKKGVQASTLVDLSEELRTRIHSHLQQALSEWSGVELQPTFVYGIRVYHRGAILKMHRDRQQTHIISAIINVDQSVDRDWPLVIEDNYYRRHEVILKPGEVVFYEGARLLHGRPEALEGNSFANIFCHFMPLPVSAVDSGGE